MAPTKTSKKDSDRDKPKAKDKEPKPKQKASNNKGLIVRPHQTTDYKEFANVVINSTALEDNELVNGGFVKLSFGLRELIMLIEVNDEIDDDIILINQYYIDLYGILLGERAMLSKFSGILEYAKSIDIETIRDINYDDVINVGIVYPGLNCNDWYIRGINMDIVNGMKNMGLTDKEEVVGYLVHPKNTKISIKKVDLIPPIFKKFPIEEIGGNDKSIQQLMKTIRIPIEKMELFQSYGITPPRGIIIHGNSGVGKSMILRSISCELRGCHIVRIDGGSLVSKYMGEGEERLVGYFKEAMRFQPSIVIVDEIDRVLPSQSKDDSSEVDGRIVGVFNRIMDELVGRVVVVGATNTLLGVDISVRRPGRFDVEIEVGVPDIEGRASILEKMMQKMNNGGKSSVTKQDIQIVAEKTHGYVGGDLFCLVREAVMKAVGRNGDLVGVEDLVGAMGEIRPSAMREVVLEMPKVKWDDIGGQKELKRKLYEMVELPLRESDKFKKMGIKAPRGVLLYGPPGCSKTMAAKALATESGLNFLAIKGPELFDKYVGESERKIRAVFAKARASAPSIVFVDEIDAIAVGRDGGESSSVGKQMLNTLLNEMDGVEELVGVIVVGATNRPASIDSALLRPGRLDRHVFVGPPDDSGRSEIFAKAISKFGCEEAIVDWLVAETNGFSGSECVLVCQEAGLKAISDGRDVVIKQDFKDVLNSMVSGITEEMLEYFKEWGSR